MNSNTYALRARRPLTVDGVRPGPLVPVAARTAATPPRPPQRRVYFQPKPAPKEHKLMQRLQLPLLLLAGGMGGFFADNVALGLALLGMYGIFAFIARVPSRTTFTLALLLLGTISLLLLFKPNMQLIGNFATYAFVLLLIGVITLGREARLPKRTPRKYRR